MKIELINTHRVKWLYDNCNTIDEMLERLSGEIEYLEDIRELGAKVGVALAPSTTLDVLEYIIEDIDHVILLTVNPGYKGQPLVPQTMNKIQKPCRVL